MVYEKYLPLHMKQNTLYLFETIPNKLEAQCIKKAIQVYMFFFLQWLDGQ